MGQPLKLNAGQTRPQGRLGRCWTESRINHLLLLLLLEMPTLRGGEEDEEEEGIGLDKIIFVGLACN